MIHRCIAALLCCTSISLAGASWNSACPASSAAAIDGAYAGDSNATTSNISDVIATLVSAKAGRSSPRISAGLSGDWAMISNAGPATSAAIKLAQPQFASRKITHHSPSLRDEDAALQTMNGMPVSEAADEDRRRELSPSRCHRRFYRRYRHWFWHTSRVAASRTVRRNSTFFSESTPLTTKVIQAAGIAGRCSVDMHFDPIITNPGRLSILTALLSEAQQDFVTLRRNTRMTDGNLTTHARKLATAGMVTIEKAARAGRPVTIITLTTEGRSAFEQHVNQLTDSIRPIDVAHANTTQEAQAAIH